MAEQLSLNQDKDGKFITDYEVEVERYRASVPFKDETGYFILNGVRIQYDFKAVYVSCMSHIEFNSGKQPNLITETGYRSWFVSAEEFKGFKSIKEVIEQFIKEIKKPYTLKFIDEEENKMEKELEGI